MNIDNFTLTDPTAEQGNGIIRFFEAHMGTQLEGNLLPWIAIVCKYKDDTCTLTMVFKDADADYMPKVQHVVGVGADDAETLFGSYNCVVFTDVAGAQQLDIASISFDNHVFVSPTNDDIYDADVQQLVVARLIGIDRT